MRYTLDVSNFDNLIEVMKDYAGNTEDAINEVLHSTETSNLLQESIKRLMPVSGRYWGGKRAPAKSGKSLRSINSNLAVTITTTKNYQYLYFPDDGSNTRRHIGGKEFFYKGGMNVQEDIINRCISKLIEPIN